MSMRTSSGILIVTFGVLLLVPHTASGQAASGAIAGSVEDTTGGALPGVTVEVASPALIEGLRTAFTDGQGNYRITDLRPGVYDVTFRLPGFSTVVREGIELTTGFTANVDAELQVGSIEETITVTAATPIVDVQTSSEQQVFTADVLEALPSGQRDLTQMASLTLGAVPSTADRNDVGGDRSEASTGLSIHGSRGDDGRVAFDGFNANVFFGGGGGQQRTYKFNTVAVAEQVVDVSGNSIQTETGGANINMVPREGGNQFSVLVSSNFTNESLASGAVSDELRARGIGENQKSMKQVWDYGVGIGGPIVRDRIWFYSANRWWGSQSYAANNFFNKSTLFYEYVPDLDRPAFQDIWARDYGARFTLQATENQKFSLQYHYQESCSCWQSIAATAAPDAQFSFFYTPHHVTQGSWTFPATNELLFQAGVGYMIQGVQFQSRGAPDAPGRRRITDINFPGKGTYIWGGTYNFVFNDNGERQQQNNVTWRASTSYITGSTEVQVGTDGQWGMFNQRGNVPAGGYDYIFFSGAPMLIGQYAGPFRSDGRISKLGAYASGRWTFDRLTINAGVRYDHHRNYTLPVDIAAGPFIGERHFDGIDNVPNYKDLSPRAGAAYDLFGDGKTAIRASWGRYLVGVAGGPLTSLSPGNAVVASANRLWFDSPLSPVGNYNFFTGAIGNADFEPDCDLTNFAPNGECGPITTAGFGTPNIAFAWDPSARQGWGIREFNYQWSVALQQEVRPGFGVSIGYYHTEFHNGQIAVDTALGASDFNSYCVPVPTDARLGSASGQQVCGNVDRTLASRAIPPEIVWFRTKDAPIQGLTGERIDKYDGIDIAMDLRFGAGGLISGGVSIGRRLVDDCFLNDVPQVTGIVAQAGAGGASDVGPRDPRYCSNAAQPLWSGIGSQVKLQAVYPLPYDFLIAGTYKHLPGIPIGGEVVYANDLIAPSLGRNLSSCGTLTGPCGDNSEIVVTVPGELYDTRLNQVDLRLMRRFNTGAVRFTPTLDLYNVFNARPSQNNAESWGVAPAGVSAGFLGPAKILGGRLLKFGVLVDF